ncbi:mucin-binding protein [Apilactobacillus kunkeei]|uniref:mucin-binding protein n=1 Tax=Apilactobacillus kunkeei TaxID=148814 RepID=UPI00403488C6
MSREVKEKKILHKVKKNWVVIGMSTVALLGTGYVVSQDNNITPAAVVAHADELSSNYVVPSSEVSASISNLGSQTSNVKKNDTINYGISLSNNDNLGRIIPKGTQIKINVNTPSQTSFSDVFNYSIYSKYSNQNVFDYSVTGNTIILTTNSDVYPGTVNTNLSLVVKGPKYNWDGDSTDHENNPSPVNISLSSTVNLPKGTEQPVNTDGTQISVLPNTKSEDEDTKNSDDIGIPGYLSPKLVKTYPDDVPGYSTNNTKGNYLGSNQGNAYYAPVYTNKDGKPYFVVTGEFNRGNIPGYYGTRISFNDGKYYDLNNLKLYASKDGNNFRDISNEPGVSFGIDSNGALYADFSKSAYTRDYVDFVAYRPYTDLTASYFVIGYGNFYRADTGQEGSQTIGHYSYKIAPSESNIDKSWIIAPDTTVYTHKDGNYTYNSGILTKSASVYRAVNGKDGSYETVENPQIKVSNNEKYNDDQIINVAQGTSKDINLTYSADGAVNNQAKLHVINPYVSIPDQQVTRNVKVNYIDSVTGNVLRTDTGSSVFKASGLKDTRNNEVTWGNWSNVSGDGTYNFTVPTIDGYVPEDNSNVTGQLYPLGNDVTRNVYMDPTEQVTSTNTVKITAVPKDKTKHIGTSTESAPIDGYQETKYVTFTRTGTKNKKTDNVTWGKFTPDSQTVSFTAPNIPGYYLISNGQKDYKILAPTEDKPREIIFPFLYKPMSDVTRTTKGNVSINYIDEDTKQEIHDPYTKDFEFTQAGKKNDQNGEVTWDGNGYTPTSQSYSVTSPQIDGYELVNSSQSTVSGTINGGDSDVVDTVSYKKIATSSSSDTNHSAASGGESQYASSASSSSSHGNNDGNQAIDKHDTTASTATNKDTKRLPQTGDQTHENALVAIGTALIAMALGLVFFASRRKRK